MSAENYIVQMQLKRFEAFKAQDPANLDVTFEVDGKLIYANKHALEPISTTLKSMLSERWSSKDKIIKLDTYSYDNFYQFLTFVYSGTCVLTDENVATMTDMAEFYNVSELKDFCDEYISKMEYNMDNVFDILDLAAKYSLPKSKVSINVFVQANFSTIVHSDKFMALAKSSIEALVTFYRDANQEEGLFEAIYKWAENQFISDENPIKQKYANMNEGMKAELSTILPRFQYERMSPEFLYGFVATKSFLFTPEEFTRMLCDYHKITVTVHCSNGTCLRGSFLDNWNIYDAINAINANYANYRSTYAWYCNAKPTKPSALKKSENVQHYFVLTNGRVQVRKQSEVTEDDYLLCEMDGDSEFLWNYEWRIFVSRNCFSS